MKNKFSTETVLQNIDVCNAREFLWFTYPEHTHSTDRSQTKHFKTVGKIKSDRNK